MGKFEVLRKTISAPINFSGKGVHSGRLCTIILHPAESGNNIVFQRTDLIGSPIVKASINNISDDKLMRRTTLTENGVSVFTVEHVISALYGLGITDCLIEMNQEEPPFIDGSSQPFVEAIISNGVRELKSTITGYYPDTIINYQTKEAEFTVLPAEDFQVTFFYNSNHPGLRAQSYTTPINSEDYLKNIAPARTFCFFEEIEMMRSAGLIKGANLNSAVVIGRKSIINSSLRFDTEPVRHKILDFIGDIALIEFPIRGHYLVWKGGHKVNAEFAKQLKKEICCA